MSQDKKWYQFSGVRRSRGAVVPSPDTFGSLLNTWHTAAVGSTFGTSRATRAEALSVPAVISPRNRLLAAIGGLPLQQTTADFVRVPNKFLDQPDKNRTRRAIVGDTVQDLLFDGSSLWEVTARDSAGFPYSAQHISWQNWQQVQGGWRIQSDGASRLVSNNDVIFFEGAHGGILNDGASGPIKDAIMISNTATNFAATPLPAGYFTTRDPNEEPEKDLLAAFLVQFAAARSANTFAFVPGSLEYATPGMNPEQMQLAETRRQNTVGVAQAVGADLESLGVSTTSRVYRNDTSARREYIDFAVSLYTGPIEDRLSLPDVTPRGHVVKFNLDELLRADPQTRQSVYDSGLTNGSWTPEEIRVAEGKPAVKAPPAPRPPASVPPAP